MEGPRDARGLPMEAKEVQGERRLPGAPLSSESCLTAARDKQGPKEAPSKLGLRQEGGVNSTAEGGTWAGPIPGFPPSLSPPFLFKAGPRSRLAALLFSSRELATLRVSVGSQRAAAGLPARDSVAHRPLVVLWRPLIGVGSPSPTPDIDQ